eukprot:9081384-Pyramimonas_sp.AAC.1
MGVVLGPGAAARWGVIVWKAVGVLPVGVVLGPGAAEACEGLLDAVSLPQTGTGPLLRTMSTRQRAWGG